MYCQIIQKRGDLVDMADFIVMETTAVLERVAAENKKLGDNVRIWLRKGKDGECILRVIPCIISTETFGWTTSKGIQKTNWIRKITYNPENFDVSPEEWASFIDDVWMPIRDNVKKSVMLFKQTKEKGDSTITQAFRLQTLNAYKTDDGPKDLPDDLKEYFLQEATGKLLDFFLEHMKPEIQKVVEKTEKYCRKKFN